LDVGGAPGVTAQWVGRRFGFDTTDASAVCVVDPADESDCQGPLEDFAAEGDFDLILCCQTVDHLTDLKGGLEKMRGLLSEDGILWLDILDWRYRLRQTKTVEGAVKIDHPFNLTESTFEFLLACVGFRKLRKVLQGPHVGYVLQKGAVPQARPIGIRETSVSLVAEIREIQARGK